MKRARDPDHDTTPLHRPALASVMPSTVARTGTAANAGAGAKSTVTTTALRLPVSSAPIPCRPALTAAGCSPCWKCCLPSMNDSNHDRSA